MSTPTYKGPRQPVATNVDGLGGWLGGLFGGQPTPAYKAATPTPCPTPTPTTPTQKSDPDPTQAPPVPADVDCTAIYALDYGDATVIPIPASGGPVTIVIPARP